MIRWIIATVSVCLAGFAVSPALSNKSMPPATDAGKAKAKLQLKNGDRVLLVGGSFLERDRHHGSLETMLRSRFPGVAFTLRNIAWPGDTTDVQLRPLNFERLEDTLRRQDASVVFVCYGSSEAFAGAGGVERFVAGYRHILDKLAASKPHTVVLLSPVRQEALGLPGVDAARYNRDLKLYVEAIRRLAADRGHLFADLYSTVVAESDLPPRQPLTANGVHLTPWGYQKAMAETARQLGLEVPAWEVELDAGAKKIVGRGCCTEELEVAAGSIRFIVRDDRLPMAATDDAPADAPPERRILKVSGLAPGDYTLSIDGREVARAAADAWARGIDLVRDPAFDQGRRLRQAICDKDYLFFNRWRAHNGEYIYGRRAHPGGGNSGNPTFPQEFAEFDKRLQDADKELAELSLPKSRRFELTPVRP